MAVRGNAAADYIIRTTTVPNEDPLTVIFRMRLRADRNASASVFYLGNGDATQYVQIRLDTDGTTLRYGASAISSVNGSSLTVDTWYDLAIVVNGTSHLFYLNGVQDGTLTISHSVTPTTLILMSDSIAYIDGTLEDIKIYQAALTVAEVIQESSKRIPARFTNLWSWYPLLSATDLVDYSGNGRDLTANGTLVTEDGAPVSWGSSVRLFFSVAGSLFTQSVDSTINVSQSIVKYPQIIRSHAVHVAQTIQKFIDKTLAQNITGTENRIKATSKSFSDTATVSQSITKAPNKVTSHAITISDSLEKLAGKIITATISATQTLARNIYKTLNDSITVGYGIVKSAAKSFSSTVQISQSLLKAAIKLVISTISVSENNNKVAGKVFTNTVNVSHALQKFISKIINSTISIAQSISTQILAGTQYLTITTNIAVGQSLTKLTHHIETIQVSATQTLQKMASVIRNESVSVTQSIQNRAEKIFTDSVGIIQTLEKTSGKIITNIVTVTENRLKSVYKIIQENILAAGTVNKLFGIILTSTINVIQSITTVVNATVTEALIKHRNTVTFQTGQRIISYIGRQVIRRWTKE